MTNTQIVILVMVILLIVILWDNIVKLFSPVPSPSGLVTGWLGVRNNIASDSSVSGSPVNEARTSPTPSALPAVLTCDNLRAFITATESYLDTYARSISTVDYIDLTEQLAFAKKAVKNNCDPAKTTKSSSQPITLSLDDKLPLTTTQARLIVDGEINKRKAENPGGQPSGLAKRTCTKFDDAVYDACSKLQVSDPRYATVNCTEFAYGDCKKGSTKSPAPPILIGPRVRPTITPVIVPSP